MKLKVKLKVFLNMLQQTIYILNAVRTENSALREGRGLQLGLVLKGTHKSQISAPLAPSTFSSFFFLVF